MLNQGKNLRIGLNLDEQEALMDLLDMPGYKILVNKVLPYFHKQQQDKLHTLPILCVDDFTKLAIKRAEIDGVKEFLNLMQELKKAYKSQAN